MPDLFKYDPKVLRHVDSDAAMRRSREVIDWTRDNFSKRKYEAVGSSVAIHWLPTWIFDAYAARPLTAADPDVIAISEGVPIALHDDAESFVAWTTREIWKPHFDPLYRNLGLPKLRGVPPDLDQSNAIDRMFRSTMAWLYLHEQAHLFQRHLDLPGVGTSTRFVHEFATASEEPVGGAAAARHACEIAADYEATILSMQLLILSDDVRILPGTLWAFFAGLTCLFQRFFGAEERALDGEAVGTHPPPSYRMWLTRNLILGYLSTEKAVERFQAPRDLNQVRMLLDHAGVTASMFWNARNKRGQRVDDFLNGAAGLKPAGSVYQTQVSDAWRAFWPIVEESHFGWPGTVPEPDYLSSIMTTYKHRPPFLPT